MRTFSMRDLHRRSASSGGHIARIVAAAGLAVALLVPPKQASAREVGVVGQQTDQFGRIVLTFDEVTKVGLRASNGVLVITFADAARIKSERLASEVGRFVSSVRRDPDGTGLRLALVAPVRPNLLEAGERIYIDLLPQNWTGLPPGLPPDVVAELAERARVAEAKLKSEKARAPAPAKPVRLQLAQLPTLTRLVFEPPPGTPTRHTIGPDGVLLSFAGASALDSGGEKPKTSPGVEALEAKSDGTSLAVGIKPASGYEAHVFPEGDTLVVDLARPAPPPKAEPRPARVRAADAKPAPAAARPVESAQPLPAPAPPPPPALPASLPAPPAPEPSPPATPAVPPGRVSPRVDLDETGTSILFPFRGRTPAAAYERNGQLNLVFETRDSLAPVQGADRIDAFGQATMQFQDGLVVFRITRPTEQPARLVPEGTGWRLWLTGGTTVPPDVVKVSRTADASGRSAVLADLPGASRVLWLREPDGQRVGVATAAGRVQGLAIARHFVEFALPATLHGIAVEAFADDVTVGLGQGGVLVTRDAGLSLSPESRFRSADGGVGLAASLVVTRDGWIADISGATLERYQALIGQVADAPRSGRGESRFRLARFLIANDLNHEADSLLALARSEDPVFARRRETSLLSGIAATRAGRPVEAAKHLSGEVLAHDPEAVLWRAVAEATANHWPQALAGFRRSAEIIDMYPDELAGPLRLLVLRAALEGGDLAKAEAELAAIDRLAPGSLPRGEHDFARTRLDEAAGRTDLAVKGYEKLAEDPNPRLAAEARLRGVALGTRLGLIDIESATDRLEILSVAWRGGEVEIGTIVELADDYAKAKRWRDLFAMTRRASRLFPEHELTRSLYDRTAHLLENLLLGAEGEQLTAVQALALYFDFKELAPIGRRGDEIVRRLADRMVELDLLDQAADLLSYQVNNRLTGTARATVAARLATVRLMSGSPIQALEALHTTRLAGLPEDVRRFRLLLEARGNSDLARSDLALELLDGETGADFDRLRAQIYWTGRRWREAGEAAEALVGTRWSGPEPLNDRERADVIRAALAAVLGDERIALDRLRQKFGRKMMDSPDAATFELLMRPNAAATGGFRDALRATTRSDGLRELLVDWRARHPDVTAPVQPPALAPVGAASQARKDPEGPKRSG